MSQPRVLLMQLSERTSAKGNTYLAGWLGKASVVAFQAAEPDKFGNPVWDLFVSTPEPRTDQARLALAHPPPAATDRPAAKPSAQPQERGDGWRGSRYRRPNGAQRGPEAAGEGFLEDDLSELGRQ